MKTINDIRTYLNTHKKSSTIVLSVMAFFVVIGLTRVGRSVAATSITLGIGLRLLRLWSYIVSLAGVGTLRYEGYEFGNTQYDRTISTIAIYRDDAYMNSAGVDVQFYVAGVNYYSWTIRANGVIKSTSSCREVSGEQEERIPLPIGNSYGETDLITGEVVAFDDYQVCSYYAGYTEGSGKDVDYWYSQRTKFDGPLQFLRGGTSTATVKITNPDFSKCEPLVNGTRYTTIINSDCEVQKNTLKNTVGTNSYRKGQCGTEGAFPCDMALVLSASYVNKIDSDTFAQYIPVEKDSLCLFDVTNGRCNYRYYNAYTAMGSGANEYPYVLIKKIGALTNIFSANNMTLYEKSLESSLRGYIYDQLSSGKPVAVLVQDGNLLKGVAVVGYKYGLGNATTSLSDFVVIDPENAEFNTLDEYNVSISSQDNVNGYVYVYASIK